MTGAGTQLSGASTYWVTLPDELACKIDELAKVQGRAFGVQHMSPSAVIAALCATANFADEARERVIAECIGLNRKV